MYTKSGGLLVVPYADIFDVDSVVNSSHPTGVGKHTGMRCLVETSGVFILYRATGRLPSDEWLPAEVSSDAYCEVSLDTTATTTRTITDTTQDLPFILTYNADIINNFTYDDTTKVITYTGVNPVTLQISMAISMERTDTGGTPLLEYFIERDSGAGYVKVDKSRVFREYTNTDVGNAASSFLCLCEQGFKYRPGLRLLGPNVSLDFRNLTMIWHTVKS